jgi:hypothetical protein
MKETNPPETKSQSPQTVRDRLKLYAAWSRRHSHVIILAFVLIIAAFIRVWPASISAGPDPAQFWAFAKVFQQHGLNFYRYADAQLDIFPMKGWAYVYPPIWVMITRVCLFFSPSGSAASVAGIVSVSPVMAPGQSKCPIIMADLAIGLLLILGRPRFENPQIVIFRHYCGCSTRLPGLNRGSSASSMRWRPLFC